MNVREELTKALEIRDKNFPIRETQNSKLCNSLIEKYIKELKQTSIDFKPNNAFIKTAEKISENAVFVCGPPKSGTTFLTELLDGHPNLVVLPADSGMRRLIERNEFFENYEKWATHWVRRFINPKGQVPFWILGDDKTYQNFYHYIQFWLHKLPTNQKNLILSIPLSYYCVNPKRPNNFKYWVEKYPLNEFHVKTFKELFPKAKFLHITRNLFANLASLKRLAKNRNEKWNYLDQANRLKKSKRLALQFKSEEYHILEYENLVEDTQQELEKIYKFLQIENISEITPTVNKVLTKTNSMYKSRISQGKIVKTKNNNWKNELTPEEIKILNE